MHNKSHDESEYGIQDKKKKTLLLVFVIDKGDTKDFPF